MKITIAGAGVIGCAIAYELASRGADVHVIDGRGPAGGATRASAGILAPYIEGHHASLLRLGIRSMAMYPEFVDRLVRDSAQSVEYERCGSLQTAMNGTDLVMIQAASRQLAAGNVDHELIDAAALCRLEPSVTPDALGALHIPEQGYVAAGEFTRALAAASMRSGATIDVTPALGVESGAVPRVRTADVTLESDAVIIAAGSWSASLEVAHENVRAVKPIRGQLVRLRLTERAARRIIWGSGCYLVPRRDGLVLVGATVEDAGFDERATVAGVTNLLAEAVALMPALRGAAFEEVRVGLRPMTADELPAVGPSSTMPHVFYATGHYRNGVLLAPLTARLIADLVLDGRVDDDLALLRPGRLGL